MDRLECDRMFIAVMEAESFVGGSLKRGTSPTQASKLVARLEDELGVRLLNRTTRSVSPTEAGQAYYERLRPLLEELETLDLEVRNISQTPRGRLRMTAPLTFGVLELAPALNVFASRYPDIELDVSFSDRVINLVEEGFDVAVRVGRPRDSSLMMRKLLDVRIVVVASPAYLEAHAEPMTPDDLAGHDCIIDTNFREPTRWPFRFKGEEATQFVTVSGRIRYSNGEACLSAAEAGLGLACVPEFLAKEAIRSEGVVRLLREFESDPYDVHVLYPHKLHLAAKVRLLVEFLAEHYRGKPAIDRSD